MTVVSYFEQISAWCAQTLTAHPALSIVAIAALVLLAVYGVFRLLLALFGLSRAAARAGLKRKRRDFHGFGILLSGIIGPGGAAETKALREYLTRHLGTFTFGAPVDVSLTRPLHAKGQTGLRQMASQRMESVASNLVAWGKASRKTGIQLDLMSTVIDPETGERRLETIHLPSRLSALSEADQKAAVYLFARVLQPRLADATGFRREKIKPIADILSGTLTADTALPSAALKVLENDFCAMALHAGTPEDYETIVKLRRQRLMGNERLDRQTQIRARIDLGRALLLLSEKRLDPKRVREAMDHLKQAIDLLREHPALRIATATSDAVREGERLLTARRRFSVTGGSPL